MTTTEIVKLTMYLRDQFWSEADILKLIEHVSDENKEP